MTDGPGFSYVLPLRWEDGSHRDEMTRYLRWLATECSDVIVVDGSPMSVFAANALAWQTSATHVAPDPAFACLMGKGAGVETGIRRAREDKIVLADDDVRYARAPLQRVVTLLAEYDLISPQNFFEPLPWHARWDTARTLINRALGGDYSGTLGLRRSTMIAMGGYDRDVMFDNLELIRTVQVHGGRTFTPLDLYVRRLPPTASHFWGQRTRQAYDDFAFPVRMLCWLLVMPSLVAAAKRTQLSPVFTGAVGSMLLAERGRRRAGGTQVFPVSSSFLAPVWIAERGICAWLAVLQRAQFGGVRYRGSVIPKAAHSKRALRRELDTRIKGQVEPSVS